MRYMISDLEATSMSAVIRIASIGDAAQIAAIYAPFVINTPTSFEMEPPTVEEMAARIASTVQQYPWLVCVNADQIMGYAYASAFRSRAAYQWSADTTVYTHEQFRRMGVGRGLYNSLLQILRLQGFYNACAGITLPNPGSEGLHRAVGFEQIALYRRIGYKLGRWHDVSWWQRSLQPDSSPASPPIPISGVVDMELFASALEAGTRCLHARSDES